MYSTFKYTHYLCVQIDGLILLSYRWIFHMAEHMVILLELKHLPFVSLFKIHLCFWWENVDIYEHTHTHTELHIGSLNDWENKCYWVCFWQLSMYIFIVLCFFYFQYMNTHLILYMVEYIDLFSYDKAVVFLRNTTVSLSLSEALQWNVFTWRFIVIQLWPGRCNKVKKDMLKWKVL